MACCRCRQTTSTKSVEEGSPQSINQSSGSDALSIKGVRPVRLQSAARRPGEAAYYNQTFKGWGGAYETIGSQYSTDSTGKEAGYETPVAAPTPEYETIASVRTKGKVGRVVYYNQPLERYEAKYERPDWVPPTVGGVYQSLEMYEHLGRRADNNNSGANYTGLNARVK